MENKHTPEKNPPPATQPEAGEIPLRPGSTAGSGEETEWARSKLERTLMRIIAAQMAELQLLLDAWRRGRR